jgi:hypothetical protein
MFCTNLWSKKLFAGLIVFSLVFGLGFTSLASPLPPCVIQEEDPEEEEDEEEPSAKLINKKYKVNAGAFQNVDVNEKLTEVEFEQQENGRVRLEVQCDTEMKVPTGSPAQRFTVSISVTTPNGGTTFLEPQDYDLQPGQELTVNNQSILRDGYTQNQLTVVYLVQRRDLGNPLAELKDCSDWTIVFTKKE